MTYPDDYINRVICGDSLKVMREIPDGSVNMQLCSPPYWGLRDYGVDGQLGLESSPELFLERLWAIFDEVRRVLRDDGTCWVNLGDTYGGANSRASNGGRAGFGTEREGIFNRGIEKCLTMIPERFAIGMIDPNFRALTEWQARGKPRGQLEAMIENAVSNQWRSNILRNKIIWHKPNPMPSSVKDRFSNTWEYLFFFSKSKRYWFDLDSVREPHAEQSIARAGRHDYTDGVWAVPGGIDGKHGRIADGGKNPGDYHRFDYTEDDIEALKTMFEMTLRQRLRFNKDCAGTEDLWTIATQSFAGAHFATFPEKLCLKPIKAGCPKEVCPKCGKARVRITEKSVEFASGSGKAGNVPKGKHEGSEQAMSGDYDIRMGPQVRTKTLGFSDCGCGVPFVPGVVLDMFSGAGTTGLVAKKLGRDYIGCDLSEEYCRIARRRIANVQYQNDLFE